MIYNKSVNECNNSEIQQITTELPENKVAGNKPVGYLTFDQDGKLKDSGIKYPVSDKQAETDV